MPGTSVLLNPSWVAPPTEPEKGCITQPEVTRAVADIVREMGTRSIIAESSAVGVDTEKVIEGSGYLELREKGYEVIDLFSAVKPKLAVVDGIYCQEGLGPIFGETPEIIGAEHILAKRAATKEVEERLYDVVNECEERVRASGMDIRGANPAPGNIAGGITTI
jgi:altronate dehydratase large subunit